MNILFYSSFYPSPMSGGVERSTWNLFQGLQERFLHTCHVLYDRRKFEITNPPKTIVQIPQSDKQQQISFIRKYLTDHQIQIIIIQGIYDKLSYFAEAAHDEILIAYVFHGEPAFPYKTFTIDYICSLIKYRGRVSWGVHRLLKFPMRKLKLRYELYLRHKQTNQAADYFVFLSRYCANAYKRYSFSSIEDRSFVIPNSLSFDIEGDESIIKHKQKHVLLVARFEEFTKRILWALKIWNRVQCKYHLDDWVLDIVGDGEDRDLYENYLQAHPTKNIVFHGTCDSQPFYKKAAIYIQTSITECFPLTILEAKQLGCVPIAFKSYAAAPDLITQNRDGYLIKEGRINKFAKTIYELAKDDDMRNKMALAAMQSVDRFSKEKVLNLWDSMLTKIIQQ